MRNLGFRVTLSHNVKDGISGMRIVRFEDIKQQTERIYKPGYTLSEITNKIKIKDIKLKLAENFDKILNVFTDDDVQEHIQLKNHGQWIDILK